MIMKHLVVLLYVFLSAKCCPTSVTDQLQLLSLPLPCFRELYDSNVHDGIKISRVINQRLELYKRQLQKIKMQDWEYLKTAPVLKWAQSESQIFIGFKLSHRQDSPTCSDIRDEHFNTTNVVQTESEVTWLQNLMQPEIGYSSIQYSGQCYFTHQKLLFTLQLDFQSILTNLTLRRQGLGSYVLVADKVSKAVWTKPFTNYLKASIWPQMRQKHYLDMDKYFELSEAVTEKSSKGKKKRRPKKVDKVEDNGQDGEKKDTNIETVTQEAQNKKVEAQDIADKQL